jgi:Alpha/beta hydrolase domain
MRCLLLLCYCVFFGTAFIHAGQSPPPAEATLAGPVTGGKGQAFGALTAQDLAASRFTEAEYFVSGTSQAYAKAGAWGMDGKWAVTPAARADYAIRILVRRPSDPRRFNGILIVEWLNVTSMQEGAADYMQMKEEIERSGYAWVGIGAQASGVNAPGTGLKAWDPERYTTLVHPGDAFSYDIVTQATRALLKPAKVNPLAGLRVQHVIATGRSQSAFRLVTYHNAFQQSSHVFNGFLIHSRGANAAGLSAEQLNRDPDPIVAGARLREDAAVPVLDLQTEGDMVTLRSHTTRQTDHPHYRRWEIAGAAHAESPQWIPGMTPVPDMAPGLRCASPINSAPHHAVVKAALHALTRWVRDGVAPRSSAPIELGDPAAPDPIVRDAFGIAKGGIRLPEVEAPTARIDGLRNDVPPGAPGGQNFCFLFGRTEPLDAATLAKAYPTHDAFVRKFTAAVDEIVRLGYWLEPEGDLARAAAVASPVGR